MVIFVSIVVVMYILVINDDGIDLVGFYEFVWIMVDFGKVTVVVFDQEYLGFGVVFGSVYLI